MTDMGRSWLVQRLCKPYQGRTILGDPNTFSFGGGLKNGGLSEDAMSLINPLFRFDYMGAAEFEFGEVPKALQKIARASEDPGLVAGVFTINLSDVPPDWRSLPKGARPETKKYWKTDEVASVFYLCPKGWEQEVESRVRGWAGVAWNTDLKEATRLSSTLRPYSEWDGEVQGWLELNNGFMFFTDVEMWEGTCKLFGVNTLVNDGRESG